MLSTESTALVGMIYFVVDVRLLDPIVVLLNLLWPKLKSPSTSVGASSNFTMVSTNSATLSAISIE